MRNVTFRVPGVSAPQGSKTPWGQEANPRTKPWRDKVEVAASAAVADRERGEWPLRNVPVGVNATFAFLRPKSHYRTGKHANVLRDDAPHFKSSQPDGDKLARAIGDSLTGTLVHDDAQIARWTITKVYADSAYALINVFELSGGSCDHAAAGEEAQAGPGSLGADSRPDPGVAV